MSHERLPEMPINSLDDFKKHILGNGAAMEQPTQAQWEEVLKWAGFKKRGETERETLWYAPDGVVFNCGAPRLDLNNLFKYAEKPLVDHFIKITATEEEYRQAYFDFLCEWLEKYIYHEPHNPTLALFWTIWEVIHE